MRADRLLAMLLLLQTRGKMTAEALAGELEVSRRTILRDVEALSFAGVPVYAEGGHGGGIALDENYRTSLTGLREMEALALFVGGSAQRLEDVGLGGVGENALLKLFAALPTAHQSSVAHTRQRILIDPDWWWADSPALPFWDDLQRAVDEDRWIRVAYDNHHGEAVERILEPYSLVAKSSYWYLVARRDGEFRTYRVSRLRQVMPLDERFQRLPDFDLPAYWRDHLHEFRAMLAEFNVVLRVHPDRLQFVQWLMPGRTRIDTPDEGWPVVRLQFESLDMAKMLVFSLGAQATVLEPPDLHEAVLQAAREILKEVMSDEG